jgi:hypothetical protein
MSWRGLLGIPTASNAPNEPPAAVEDARAALAQALAAEREAVRTAIDAHDAYLAGTAPLRMLERVRAARDAAESAAKAARRHLIEAALAEVGGEAGPEEAPVDARGGQCDSTDEYHRRYPCHCGRHRGDEGAARLQAEADARVA